MSEGVEVGGFQTTFRIPGRVSVGEYIAYLRPFYPTWDKDLEAEILAQLGLPQERKIKDLSHGMRMKMALACALPFRPRLLVLDEPFSGLDAALRDELLEDLQGWLAVVKTPVLSVTHDVGEAFQLGAEVIKIGEGRVVDQGPVGMVLAGERERLLGQLRAGR